MKELSIKEVSKADPNNSNFGSVRLSNDCDIYFSDIHAIRSEKEAVEVANLFCAAPDLLAACQSVLCLIEDNNISVYQSVKEQLVAAISKALPND